MHSKRLLRNFAIIVVVLLAILEVTARIWLRNYYASRRSEESFLLGQPDPYKDSTYFSPEFVAEQIRFKKHLPRTVHDMEQSTFTGKYYNLNQGIRPSANAPTYASNRIYLLGSSPIAASQVPDNKTIASYLQHLTPDYEVIGIGLAAATANTLVYVLETLPLQPGDIVVFYTGWADGGTPYTIITNRYRLSSLCQRLSHFKNIRMVEMLCVIEESQEPDISSVRDLVELEGSRAINAYIGAINKAKIYTKRYAGLFYNVIQPAVWSKPLSAYEANRVVETSSKLRENIWYAMLPSILSADPDAFNFVHVLDEIRAKGNEVYFDAIHVNEVANEIIAKSLYEILFPSF